MKSRVGTWAACLLVLLPALAFAQTPPAGDLKPDRGEIESAGSEKVQFINYEGPQPRIDSLAAIKGIGSSLGQSLAASPAAGRAGSSARYQVIRAIDPSVKQGLDADILVLGPDAQVDHIRNLRWIIAGYLSAAWAYSDADAFTLATFITVYDAVHRGDIPYFSSKYKAVVLKELEPGNAGLALSYAEWPGKSRIVIPLSAGAAAGRLGTVDTGAVSDKAVTESLKAQPDKGVAERQALVDVKEREAAQDQAKLDKQKADLAQAEKKLAEDRAKAEADRAALEKAKGDALEAEKARAAAAATAPGTTAAGAGQAPATATAGGAPAAGTAAPSAELATKEAAVKAEEAAVAAKTAEVAAAKGEVAAGEAAVAAKKEEAAADRKDITADQKAVIAAEVAAKGQAAVAGIYLIRVGEDPNHLAQIVLVDPDKGSAIRSSRITSLHLRSLTQVADAFLAVSGLEGKPGGVKLVRLDKTSLESVAEGKSDMFPDSALLVLGDSVYGVVKAADGKNYLARFAAADLSEKARSKESVSPWTLVSEASGNIAVQVPGAAFALLAPDTLEKIKELKP
jgi:hypothetical protein